MHWSCFTLRPRLDNPDIHASPVFQGFNGCLFVCGRRYVRREHLRLFLSFFLLLSPALEGDSSFILAWLDILEEFCWLKWLGTCRARPPWDAKLALQPPTTHCGTTRQESTRTWTLDIYCYGDNDAITNCTVITYEKVMLSVQGAPEEQMHVPTCCCIYLEGLVPAVRQHVSLEPALARGWGVVHFTSLPQAHKHLEGDKEAAKLSGRGGHVGVRSLEMAELSVI